MGNVSFFESRLIEICGERYVSRDVPMAEHTTFRTGGPADYYVTPKDQETFLKLLWYARQSEREYVILGRGSNLLVGDKGYRGLVIDTTGYLKEVTFRGDTVIAEAGAGLSMIAGMAAEASLSGLEFAAGIPGTIGGAVYMNAGAYGGEMSQVVTSVDVFGNTSSRNTILGSEMGFGYRTSIAQKQDLPILSVELKLVPGDMETIRATMWELAERRREKQPLEYPSAGSTFKRPEGYFAGKLISDTGLSGMTVGGACVSPKHNGFIINQGNATSADILDLIREVQERVKAKFGVELEPEVRIIGEF
ncbi:MAG: UDP-N-acetylmuramate dehydrogenase [Lachnospiraceae bacterium]|nr:UDP-N-acetylmuramate dehydrogenase [Lachnospiraceae bacterium]MBQ4242187.1 UDP-N-acetylmuramate dehydrogenase [Lachnospiraceae bacterium]